MRAAGIIPARYQSTRLPGKPLLRETGKYLVQHVWEQASRAASLGTVIIATDDERILRAARDFGADARMTAPSHRTGTDRAAEVAAALDCEIIVNIQGDEPEIEPGAIDAAVEALEAAPEAVISTLAARSSDPERARDPNAVKVVTGRDGRALYFSRAPIPCPALRNATRSTSPRDPASAEPSYLLHVGLYAYRREFLLKYPRLTKSPLEQIEKLEQLRALENGYVIQVAETEYRALGIDTPDDYRAFVAREKGQR